MIPPTSPGQPSRLEVRIPLGRPHHALIIRREPLNVDLHQVTLATYRIFAGPTGEHRHRIGSALSLPAEDGDALLEYLTQRLPEAPDGP